MHQTGTLQGNHKPLPSFATGMRERDGHLYVSSLHADHLLKVAL